MRIDDVLFTSDIVCGIVNFQGVMFIDAVAVEEYVIDILEVTSRSPWELVRL
jgi:hypothetical protein